MGGGWIKDLPSVVEANTSRRFLGEKRQVLYWVVTMPLLATETGTATFHEGGHTITARSEDSIATNFALLNSPSTSPVHYGTMPSYSTSLVLAASGRMAQWASMRPLIPIDSTDVTVGCTTFSRVTSAREPSGYQIGPGGSRCIIDPRHPPMQVEDLASQQRQRPSVCVRGRYEAMKDSGRSEIGWTRVLWSGQQYGPNGSNVASVHWPFCRL